MKKQIITSSTLATLLLGSTLVLTGCETMDGLMGDSSRNYGGHQAGSSYHHDGSLSSNEEHKVKHAESSGSTPAERQSENVPHVRRASSSASTSAPSLHSVNPAAVPAAPVVAPTSAPLMAAPAVGQ